ncbi:MAG TPA: branched-chain amino acid ABC transporter permease [Peptococcaceae bacterium]|nr:MAG: Amino acid/amide ABC transporter membrane protein 1, HAAT family [Moorella sp. 60_41]HBT48171.1 branched-chain amino acid ABC transporter permease [Peptococcaceae bacterium]
MAELVQQLINGLTLGGIYALIALGYTMVYGIIQLINFAHGDILMVAAYVAFFAITVLKVGVVPALVLAVVFCALLGVAIERIAYKPLRQAPRLAALITAIGVSLFLENGGLWLLGTDFRSFPPGTVNNYTYTLLGGTVRITSMQLLILALTLLVMVILQYIVHYTKVGKAMRAVAYDKEAAALMGINVDSVVSVTFALGSAFAAVAGVLWGLYYNTVHPLMGLMPGLKAFVAAVIGGIGIIPGAMAGGFFLGIIEALVSGYGSSELRDPVVFILLILVLLFRPAGLLGKDTVEKV